MGQPEYALSVAVADYLRAALPPEVLWFHVPNGEHRSKITGARLKRMGVRPGVADLCIAWRGTLAENYAASVLWIELKSPKGRQSTEQAIFHFDAVRAGHDYVTARSVADVERFIRGRGIPMRGRIAA